MKRGRISSVGRALDCKAGGRVFDSRGRTNAHHCCLQFAIQSLLLKFLSSFLSGDYRSKVIFTLFRMAFAPYPIGLFTRTISLMKGSCAGTISYNKWRVTNYRIGVHTIVGFHMMSLKFKLQNYRYY